MPKHIASKLDPFAARLEEWFLGGMKLVEAQAQLKADGCQVSLGRLSKWWQDRQQELAEQAMLDRIASGADTCKRLEASFETAPPPEMRLVIDLLKTLILKLSVLSEQDPTLLSAVTALLKPVMEWAKGEREEKALVLATHKFQRETATLFLKWRTNDRARAIADGPGDNDAKTEALGQLMFGEDWS